MPITRSGKMSEGKRMTEEELLAFQTQLIEREKLLQNEAHKLESSRKQAEQTINAEWEKVRQSKQNPDISKILERMENMQGEMSRLSTLYNRQNVQSETPQPPQLPQIKNIETSLNIPKENTIGLKDVLSTIPNFTGYDISVFHFSRACERARDMLPRNLEFSLVQMTLNKLKGHAFQLLQDIDVQTIEELITQLKNTFAPRKTINQYKGELGNIHQNPGESVMEYAGRLKDIKAGLLDCERQTRGEITNFTKNEVDQDSLESFVNGLLSQTRIYLKIEGYANLNDAISKAVRISKTLETERKRFGNKFDNARNDSNQRNMRYNQGNNNYNQRNNNYGPQRIERNEPQREKRLNPNAVPYAPRNNAPTQNNNFTPKICSYCNIQGHDRSQCRKLAYRNAQPSTSGVNKDNTRPINFLEEGQIEPDPPPELQTLN